MSLGSRVHEFTSVNAIASLRSTIIIKRRNIPWTQHLLLYSECVKVTATLCKASFSLGFKDCGV